MRQEPQSAEEDGQGERGVLDLQLGWSIVLGHLSVSARQVWLPCMTENKDTDTHVQSANKSKQRFHGV